MQQAFDYLDAPVIRVTGKDVPMPYAANLEKLALPNVDEVIAAVNAVTYQAEGELTMPINITMPALSPTMEEGKLAKWHVKEGDTVSSGDVIAEIETDKATMEVEAVDEGKIGKIVVAEGTEDVKVNARDRRPAEEGERRRRRQRRQGRSAEGRGRRPRRPRPKRRDRAARSSPSQPAPTPSQHRPRPGTPSADGGERVFASPLARRLAKEAGIDLSAIYRLRPAWAAW